MERRRIIDINGSGGAFVAVAATMNIRRMVIRESLLKADGSANTPQGLNYRVANDDTAGGFTTVFAIDKNDGDQIELGSLPTHGAQGEVIGSGPTDLVGGSIDGTHLADLRSATANASAVEVIEYS